MPVIDINDNTSNKEHIKNNDHFKEFNKVLLQEYNCLFDCRETFCQDQNNALDKIQTISLFVGKLDISLKLVQEYTNLHNIKFTLYPPTIAWASERFFKHYDEAGYQNIYMGQAKNLLGKICIDFSDLIRSLNKNLHTKKISVDPTENLMIAYLEKFKIFLDQFYNNSFLNLPKGELVEIKPEKTAALSL